MENKNENKQNNPMGLLAKLIKSNTGEIKTLIYVSIAVVLFASYFIHNSYENTKKEISDTKRQIEIVLNQNIYLQKNIKAFEGSVCWNCHNNPTMFLPKTSISLDDFIKYVRGTRFVKNSTMPVFTESDISDSKLQEMWKTLY